ncbi:host attachment family protein [Paracoccus jiaweipingae]|uniref:host attachment family protein n=1 Tax=unclassified Paracoccus (in: a-proteobacteria) TaxID=2688777 RepID=UPI0037A249B6
MLSHNALVVVADGHHALLFRNAAKQGLELRQDGKLTPQNLQDQSSGNRPEETSPRDEDELTFAKQISAHLNQLVLQHKADQVVVIADPSTLGQMRKDYHKMLEQALVKEIAKTLTNASIVDIEAAIQG